MIYVTIVLPLKHFSTWAGALALAVLMLPIVARVTAQGVAVLRRDDGDAFGRFAWIQDPDGTKIELGSRRRGRSGVRACGLGQALGRRGIVAGRSALRRAQEVVSTR